MDEIKRRPSIHATEWEVESEEETDKDEEFGNEEIENQTNANIFCSYNIPYTPESLSGRYKHYENLKEVSPITNKHNKTFKEKTSEINSLQIILGFIAYAIVVPSICIIAISTDDHVQQNKEKEYKCSFEDIKEKFPQNENILDSLQVGVNNKLNKTCQKSEVYLLTHYNNDPHHSSELISMILNETSKCLDPAMEPIYMNLKNFKSREAKDDFGLIIEEFKEKIKESKVVVVENLNEVPYQTARALHVICDTDSPVDKDVIVFLILKITEEIDEKGNGLEKVVERILKEMWSSMKNNELDPLITRVTNNVFLLKTELLK